MGRFLAQSDSYPIQDQLKTLADDELLDFWEETQVLERFLEEEGGEAQFEQDYEQLIIQELQLRSCQRSIA